MLIRKCTVLIALVLIAGTALAWGGRTQRTIVTNAAHLLSRQGPAPLADLERDIRGGASIPREVLEELAPESAVDLESAIASQMGLLQAVGGSRLDAYFAFRLGVLGRLMAEATAPLQNSSPDIRNRYYEDVDARIDGVAIRSRPRQEVEAGVYLASVRRELRTRDDVLEQEYRAGIGFDGVARSALSEDASRSINAVADTWHTVIESRTVAPAVSPRELRDYHLGAMEFYIVRGNTREIERAYERINELGLNTPEIQERIADKYYEAGHHERAMEEYRAALERDPERRHIAQRIAEHYVQVGDAALEAERLEEAKDAFAQAAEADKLNEAAQVRLVESARALEARAQRRDAALAALNRGESYKDEAEQLAERGEYANAIDQYRQARTQFENVSDEFNDVIREARINMNTIEARLGRLQDEVVANAAELSGAGSGIDPARLAPVGQTETDEEALRQMLSKEYDDAISRLRQQLEPELSGGAQ